MLKSRKWTRWSLTSEGTEIIELVKLTTMLSPRPINKQIIIQKKMKEWFRLMNIKLRAPPWWESSECRWRSPVCTSIDALTRSSTPASTSLLPCGTKSVPKLLSIFNVESEHGSPAASLLNFWNNSTTVTKSFWLVKPNYATRKNLSIRKR